MESHWDEAAVIGTDRAVVLVTALIVLVATVNVAVVASSWQRPATQADHAGVTKWVAMMSGVARAAGALTVALAVSQLLVDLVLGLVLVVVAATAVVVAAATGHAFWDTAPLKFCRYDAAQRIADVNASLAVIPAPATWQESRDSWATAKSLGVLVGVSVAAVALFALAPSLWTSVNYWDGPGGPGTFLLAVALLTLLTAMVLGLPTMATVFLWRVRVRKRTRWIRVAWGILLVTSAGCPVAAFLAGSASGPMWFAYWAAATLGGALMLLLWVYGWAWRHGTGPGKYLLRGMVASLESEREAAEAVLESTTSAPE